MSEIAKPRGWESPGEPGETRRTPTWKDAVQTFLDSGFVPGEVVPHNWFYQQFGIIKPEECPDFYSSKDAQLMYMTHIEGLKRELLEEHQIAIKAVPGKGYEVVPPQAQTAWAEEALKTDLQKALRTSKARLVNIRLDELTDDEKKSNLDAQARLSFFRKQARKALA